MIQRYVKNIDMPLLLVIAVLTVVSLGAIFSATSTKFINIDKSFLNLNKQILIVISAAILFFIILMMNWKKLSLFSWVVYGLSIIMLIMVNFYGTEHGGAQRWLEIWFIRFQPSEIAKIGLLFALAYYFSHTSKKQTKNRYSRSDGDTATKNSIIYLIPPFIIMLIPFILVAKQPDLGTAIVFIAILFGTMIGGKIDLKLILFFVTPIISVLIFNFMPFSKMLIWGMYIGVIIIAMSIFKFRIIDRIFFLILNLGAGKGFEYIWGSLHDYQRQRITSFFDRSVDPLAQSARYHTNNAVTAVGSGQFFGRGLFSGPLTQLQYIPEQSTDFIFSVIGEELGFIGVIIILFLFFVLFARLIYISDAIKDDFGRILCYGLFFMLFFQTAINIAMNLGIAPVVGLPLPFISQGGSALISYVFAIAVIMSIYIRREKLFF
ncbi:rod shape-determining protein RodA [Candidatus Margulisiibacteriota bacterium]